ncbi:MAG: hypothetical protein PHD95_04510 [Candidatus ainarchaeum sp.]|nr:hypothetical protein [Candidatus ainarchaeum sp.]
MTEIIGVEHKPHNLEECKAIIDEARQKGIRQIGIERPQSPKFIKWMQKRLEKKCPGISYNPEPDFFSQLKKYAETRGIAVVPLGSQFSREYLNRLLLEQSLAGLSLVYFMHINYIISFSSIKDTRIMVKQIQRTNLPMAIIGGMHSLGIARALGVPIDEIHFVGLTLKEALAHERFSATCAVQRAIKKKAKMPLRKRRRR